MGYQLGCFAIGYVGDVADPLSVVRDDVTGHLSIEDMQSAAGRQDSANTLMNAITDTSGARV